MSSPNKHLLKADHVPGIVLGTKDKAVHNMGKAPALL